MALQKNFGQFLKDDSGATAVEYGLLVALIAIGIVGGLVAVSTSINETFATVGNELS